MAFRDTGRAVQGVHTHRALPRQIGFALGLPEEEAKPDADEGEDVVELEGGDAPEPDDDGDDNVYC